MSASMAGSSCVMFLFGTQGQSAFEKWAGHCREDGSATHQQAVKQTGKCMLTRGRKSHYKVLLFKCAQSVIVFIAENVTYI